MYKRTILGLGLAALLTLNAAMAFAADKKENLPKKAESDQKTVEKAPARSDKTKTTQGKQDNFVDSNQNGINDKDERKVRRTPEASTSSTIKTKPPKATESEPQPKTPPRR
jgi:hypothetical protein